MPRTLTISGDYRINIGSSKDAFLLTKNGASFKALDGTPIGGTTPAAITGTTIRAATSIVAGSSSLTPDGTLHVHTASAGTVTAFADANDLVVENSSAGGVSVLVPDAERGYFVFGSPSDATGSGLSWLHSDLMLKVGTYIANGQVVFHSGNDAEGFRLSEARSLLLGGTVDPASAVGAFVQFTGTAPTGSVTDGYAQYSADQTAGNAAPHFRTEGGDIVLLFTGAALTAADGGTVNSGDATTDGVINNIRTRLGELEARMQANGLIA